jgi:hypothetical protein
MTTIQAGCSKADITPPVGTTMDGFAGRTQVSVGIHDKLFSRSVVFDDGAHSAAIVSCDVCWFTGETVAEVRRRTKALGVDYLLLSATHNHSGPAMADFLARPTSQGTEYVYELPDGIADTVRAALDSLEPVKLRIGRGRASVSVNRRATTGEIDQEVTTLVLRDASDRPKAGVVNYACHPTVLGQSNRLISADFPGLAAEKIEKRLGEGFVSLFINGAGGDVNPKTCAGYDCRGTFTDVDVISQAIADVSLDKSDYKDVTDHQGIRFAKSRVGPLRPFGLEFELSALEIDGLVVLGVPGELFASTGRWMKGRWGSLLVACYADGYVGYFPTKEAFRRKDYESQSGCWVDADAEEQVRAKAGALLDTIRQT